MVEALQLAQPRMLLNRVAPGVVGIFLIMPLLDPVVLHMMELAGVEVQAIGRGGVAEFFAVDQSAGAAAVQLAIGFVFVLDLATQFVQRADQFSSRGVAVAMVELLKLGARYTVMHTSLLARHLYPTGPATG